MIRQAVFLGAVQRIDDPDPSCIQTTAIVGRFLREHGIARPLGSQPVEDVGIGGLVAPATQFTTAVDTQTLGSDPQEDRTGGLRQFRRECLVGDSAVCGFAHRSNTSIIRSASSVGVPSSGLITSSGLVGAS